MNKNEWEEKAWQSNDASSMHEDVHSGNENAIPIQKTTKPSFFKLPVFRSVLIAFVILGIAAAIHFITASSPNERKRGVYNAKDGSVYQVEEYLKKELAKPESFEAIHWSTVEKSGEMIGSVMYKVTVIYKALDNGGKSFMSSKMFELDEEGNVWMVMDVDPFRSSPAQNSKE